MSKRTVRRLWCIRLFATFSVLPRCLEADMQDRLFYHEGHEEHEEVRERKNRGGRGQDSLKGSFHQKGLNPLAPSSQPFLGQLNEADFSPNPARIPFFPSICDCPLCFFQGLRSLLLPVAAGGVALFRPCAIARPPPFRNGRAP